MRNYKFLGKCCLIFLMIILLIIVYILGKRTPFRNVDISEIDQVCVKYRGKSNVLVLNDVEKAHFLEILQEISIYGIGSEEYLEIEGRYPLKIFEVYFTDGSITEVEPFNPYFIIDGVGYRCRYAACDKMRKLYTYIVEKYT